MNKKPYKFLSLLFVLLTLSMSLAAQSSHYIAGKMWIGTAGVFYVSNNSTVNLAGNIITTRELDEAQRGMLSLANTAEWNSGNLSFVDGFVRSYNEGAFIFPVGKTNYHPVRISAAASTAPTDAAYYSPALYSTSALDAEVGSVKNECWVVQGTTPAIITLSWTTDISSFADDFSKLFIAGWDGSKWVKIASAVDVTSLIFSTASALATNGSVSTTSPIVPNSYEAYTLASTDEDTGGGGGDEPPTLASHNHYVKGNVYINPGFMYIGEGTMVNLAGNVTTTRELDEAQRGMLSFANTAEWESGNLSFVDGFARSQNTGAFTFPVGQTDYHPVRISTAATAAPTDAAYYTPSLFSPTNLDAEVEAVTDECWIVQGATPAIITLSWTADISSFADDFSKLFIAGWEGSKWVKIASAVDVTSPIFGTASSLATKGSVSTTSAIVPNSYEAYTLAAIEITPDKEFWINCEYFTSKNAEESFDGADYYLHENTEWDVANEHTNQPLDSVDYFVNGDLVSHGTAATLYGVSFPIGISTVKLVGYWEDMSDFCEFTVTVSTFLSCPATVYDIEGNPYKVTKLEGLCWTENLKSKNYNDGTTPIPFAQSYKNEPQNEIDFGLLYTYESAMAVGVEHALPLQGICPDGWRLPTAAEWELLNIYNANDLNNTTFWLKPNSYINTTDFDVRGAGFYNSTTGRFEMIYAYTAFWSSDVSSSSATSAIAAAIKYHCDEIEMAEIKKSDALSVRCVMKN